MEKKYLYDGLSVFSDEKCADKTHLMLHSACMCLPANYGDFHAYFVLQLHVFMIF